MVRCYSRRTTKRFDWNLTETEPDPHCDFGFFKIFDLPVDAELDRKTVLKALQRSADEHERESREGLDD